jgi:hypothetical protein
LAHGRHIARFIGGLVAVLVLAAAALVFAGGLDRNIASADAQDELVEAGSFGFNAATTERTAAAHSTQETEPAAAVYERSALATPTSRDIASGIAIVEEKERIERERVAAEEAAIAGKVEANKAYQLAYFGAEQTGLSEVDWTVGKEAFLNEWTQRIDAYLAGTNLAGYGRIFAEAAWDNGVDPRWSPAISNTESGNGAHCFRSYNAWGWGGKHFPDWETAIREHVAGLAAGYGYTVTLAGAQKYCPPADEWPYWFENTTNQMHLI